jgi:hypothetical protein
MRVIKTAVALSIAALALVGCSNATPEGPEVGSLGIEVETSQSPETNDNAGSTEDDSLDGFTEGDGASEDNSSSGTEQENKELSDADVILEALMGPDGEYAALASYQSVLDKYGQVEPYATILQAEARHADALIRQLERLGVDVPENPYLGEIAAPADLQTAAEAWAEGEILNVELYDYLISQTDNTQILKVLGNLRRASLESHLPAFLAAAENGGTLDSMPAGGHSN